MTGFPGVGPGGRPQLLTALAGGEVIAVPGDQGYLLAVRLNRTDVGKLRALASDPADASPAHVLVGRRPQAIELASAWSKETQLLTDRMWPGPLTVIVPTCHDILTQDRTAETIVHISMPASRVLRVLSREGGPLIVLSLRRADGSPIAALDEVRSRFSESEVALGLDGGTQRGEGSTVVDCTVSPPAVRHAGAIPETYVEAALMLAAARRRWFGRRPGTPPPLQR